MNVVMLVGEVTDRPFRPGNGARTVVKLKTKGAGGTPDHFEFDAFGQPAGSFTQTEALACRDLLPDTEVEVAMSHGLLCLHSKTPLYRAAAAAYEARARRLLAVDDGKVVGVITGLDFARCLALHA